MKTILIGIDPGASGGIAELGSSGLISAFKMPDDPDIRDYFEAIVTGARLEGAEIVAYLEQVGGYVGGAGAPGSAMFTFGRGFGYLEGLLAANRIKTVLVRPQTWQRGLPGLKAADGKSAEKSIRKRALKEHAARLYPDLKVTMATCDALLILDYARKNNP